jgi:guanine deaminase
MEESKGIDQAAVNEAIMATAAAAALTGVTLQHGGPFGAVVMRDGICISTAHNTVLMEQDATCHAEMNAIRWAFGTHAATAFCFCN